MNNRLFKVFSSTRLMGVLLILFATSVALATFIENDFGRATAKAMIYNKWWFELIILLFAINLVLNMFIFRLFRKEKISQLMFHFSFIIIIIGAAITRYVGFEGIMHIREGDSSNIILSDEVFLQLEVTDKNIPIHSYEKALYFGENANNRFSKTFDIDGKKLGVRLKSFIPAANQVLEEVEEGEEIISLVLSSAGMGRNDIFLRKGENYPFGPFSVRFSNHADTSNVQVISIFEENGELKVFLPVAYVTMSMVNQEQMQHKPSIADLEGRTLYSLGENFFVFTSFKRNARVIWKSIPKTQRKEGISYANLLVFDVAYDGKNKDLFITGQEGVVGMKKYLKIEDKECSVSYGAKEIKLDFSIALKDFVLDRYPGSSSPSSFESYVTLIDKKNNTEEDKKIFMNNVIDYKGYRFFQSSYDKDEGGTVLSVNHDYWGTFFTYIGYFFLALGMLTSLFVKKGALRSLGRKLETHRKKYQNSAILLLVFIYSIGQSHSLSAHSLVIGHEHLSLTQTVTKDSTKNEKKNQENDKTDEHQQNYGNHDHDHDDHDDNRIQEHSHSERKPIKFNSNSTAHIVSPEHAKKIELLLIQDISGRIKPINTLATDIIRKVTKKEKINGWTPTQLFIGMVLFPRQFVTLPMIKINHEGIAKVLGLEKHEKYASFGDFWDKNTGEYMLSEQVKVAHHKKPGQRNKLDKTLIQVDERVNICYSLYDGRLLKIFPDRKSSNNKWLTPDEFLKQEEVDATKWSNEEQFFGKFKSDYITHVRLGLKTKDWKKADQFIEELKKIQKKIDENIIPSEKKISAEIFYNKAHIFNYLTKVYLLLGFLLLCFYILGITNPGITWIEDAIKGISYVVMLGFVVHTAGLGLRWYISGHAPWSDGYESLVYISWASLLAGLLFYKKYPITLAFTSIFGGLALWVAGLSLFDPQITPLVPVLKSYWLTIHVSMITASYGFFGLGAIMGLFNLFALFLKTKKNALRINGIVHELTIIIEMNLTVALALLAIGTFLGGIWANESWGRYWGWDPKESWAFISILVYAFVLHSKFIPKMRGDFVFNVLSVFSFLSILMTYFGVNFFLSGLHSYASGDPMPMPSWVYIFVGILIALSLGVYFKNSREKKMENT